MKKVLLSLFVSLFAVSCSTTPITEQVPIEFRNKPSVSPESKLIAYANGVITDSQTKTPIAGIKVKMDDKTVITDNDGYFSFNNVVLGETRLTISRDNEESESHIVTIVSGNQTLSYQYTPKLLDIPATISGTSMPVPTSVPIKPVQPVQTQIPVSNIIPVMPTSLPVVATPVPTIMPTPAPLLPTAAPIPIKSTLNLTGIWVNTLKSTISSYTRTEVLALTQINEKIWKGYSLINETEKAEAINGKVNYIKLLDANDFLLKGVISSSTGNPGMFYRYYDNHVTETGEYSGIYDFKLVNSEEMNGTFRSITNDSSINSYTFTAKRVRKDFITVNSSGILVDSYSVKNIGLSSFSVKNNFENDFESVNKRIGLRK